MKKIVVALMLCAMSFGTMTTSTASAKDRLTLDEARDLFQLGKQAAGGIKKIGNGVQRFNDGIQGVQDRLNSVRNIGKVFRRR
jgi:hypothetical protein